MTDFPTLTPLLELAFGADPDGDPDDWQFVDVSADMLEDTTTITRGRSDESSHVDATSVAFTLDNNSGDYTPDRATSQHYPNVRQNVPLRFSIAGLPAELGGPDPVVRFTGFVSDWLPSWPAGDHSGGEDGEGHAIVTLTASGVMRRQSQGDEQLPSALTRATTRRDDVVAYWPLEDEQGSTQAASPIRGVSPMRLPVPLAELGAGEDIPAGSAQGLLRVQPGSSDVMGSVPAHPATSEYAALILFRQNEATSGFRTALDVHTSSSNAARWRVRVSATQVLLEARDAEGTATLSNTASINAALFGQWVLVVMGIAQSGSAVAWSYGIFTADRALTLLNSNTGSLASTQLGRVTRMGPGAGVFAAAPEERFYGHPTLIRGTNGTIPLDTAAVHGYTGERAAVRFERLCDEDGLRCYVKGDPDTSMPMGPQRPHDLLTLLRQCADTDGGIFYEGLANFGYALRLRSDMYNSDAALDLDASEGPGEIAHPFTPALDDQQFRNDVTVENEGGSSARAVDEQSISDRGRYTESWPVNMGDDQLPLVAGWRLHLGTWPGMRYPAISPALSQVPTLIGDWLGVDLGDRIRVTGLPPQHPVGEVDLLAQGYTETFTEQTWTVEVNTTPQRPWNVWQLEHSTFGRLWSRRAYLAEDIDGEATSFDVVVPVRRALNPAPDFEREIVVEPVTTSENVDWSTVLATLTRSQAQVFTGRWSGELIPNAGSSEPRIWAGSPLGMAAGGRTYRASAWVYAPLGGWPGLVELQFRNAAGTNLGSSVGSTVTVPAGVWTRLSVTAAAPAGTSRVAMFVRGQFFVSPFAQPSDVLFIDDAEVGVPGAPFTQDAGDFPQDIIIGGEVCSVTGIGADDGTGAQTWTVVRSVNGVAKNHKAGTPVRMHPGHVISL